MIRFVFLLLLFFAGLFGFERVDKLIIAGPVATVSHPFFKVLQDNALSDVAKEVEFRVWNTPDELRALVINKQVDFVALPTNTAAILYNKGVELELIDVGVWGILDIVSRDKEIKRIEDLKGKEIVVPFRGDMPDIVLQALLKRSGLDPKKDLKLKYVATPPDAMSSLILRQSDTVLLAEPATSVALKKTGSFPLKLIAPDIFRVIDIQKEWGARFGVEPKLPVAGIASVGKQDDKITNRVLEEYQKAIKWMKKNKKESGELVSQKLDMFDADALALSLEHVIFESKRADAAKAELERFFEEMKTIEPKLIGGKLPNDGFYYGIKR